MFKKTKITELQDYIQKNGKLEKLDVIVIDLAGILRGKTLVGNSIKSFFENGIRMPRSIYVFDSLGRVCTNMPYAVNDGDPDFEVFGHAGRLVNLSENKKYAQILCFMNTSADEFCQLDSRQVLNNVLQKFYAQNLMPKMGAELEFYLCKMPDQTSLANRSTRSSHQMPISAFARSNSVESLHLMEEFFDKLVTKTMANNIEIQTLIKETGAGQFEVTFAPNQDIIRACDEIVFTKKIIRNLAAKFNLVACFMAKPFTSESGSGMHFHTSIADKKTSKNIFYGDQMPELGAGYSKQALYSITGILSMIDESMAIFAPNANSYRRLKKGSFAPIFKNWSTNNRTVAIRMPISSPSATRIEHRLSGADANPYLCAATILSAIDKGLKDKVMPPPPATGNAYMDKVSKYITRDWQPALKKFLYSKNIRQYMGTEFQKAYYGHRKFEADMFNYEVEKKDLDWYLETV